jgi:hypothetical protein
MIMGHGIIMLSLLGFIIKLAKSKSLKIVIN